MAPLAFVASPSTQISSAAHLKGLQPRRCARAPRTTSRTLAHACAQPGKSATNENALRLARWLAADWSNKAQALEDPQFWSHIHVVFRPLSYNLQNALSFYSESAYDYALGRPYKSAVYRIIEVPSQPNALELECYKVRADIASEFWMGAHEPELLDDLRNEHLERMSEHCNTVYRFDDKTQRYHGACRPGNQCIVRRAGRGPLAYIDSTLELAQHCYSAWDLGRDPDTHERLWGTPAGPFQFVKEQDLAHLVPTPPTHAKAA